MYDHERVFVRNARAKGMKNSGWSFKRSWGKYTTYCHSPAAVLPCQQTKLLFRIEGGTLTHTPGISDSLCRTDMLARTEPLPPALLKIFMSFTFFSSFLNLLLKFQGLYGNLDMKTTLSRAKSKPFTSLFLSHMPVFWSPEQVLDSKGSSSHKWYDQLTKCCLQIHHPPMQSQVWYF